MLHNAEVMRNGDTGGVLQKDECWLHRCNDVKQNMEECSVSIRKCFMPASDREASAWESCRDEVNASRYLGVENFMHIMQYRCTRQQIQIHVLGEYAPCVWALVTIHDGAADVLKGERHSSNPTEEVHVTQHAMSLQTF